MSFSKARLHAFLALGEALFRRYPGTFALFGFLAGVGSFLLVDRQAGLAKVIAVVMLVSWLWLVLENGLRRQLARRFGWSLPPVLVRYATQMVHQESLFFVLPFFAITTTWNSGQAAFTGLLGTAALVSVIDPLYYKRLASRRWLFFAFHSLTLFAVLLTALPILLHLSTAQSYAWALGVSLLLATPSLAAKLNLQGGWRWTALLLLLVALGGLGWLLRQWVPPATLWLTEVAVTTRMDSPNREPGKRLIRIGNTDLHTQGLFAYTAINAPRGLKERIYHVWRHDGRVVERIALDIHGGRKQGYRAWTHKLNFPADSVGHWQVRVVTEAGQLIGILRFRVEADD